MRGLSLQETLMEVARGLEEQPVAATSQKSAASKNRSTGMSELDAFASLDPLLADLQKEFLNTKARAKELVSAHGIDDPMAAIAADLEDSAWCRMQTRYLELRAQRDLMKRVQTMQREEEREAERKERNEKQSKIAAFMHQIFVMQDMRKSMLPSWPFEWFAFMMFLNWKEAREKERYYSLQQQFAA
jgi:hypothetical protein